MGSSDYGKEIQKLLQRKCEDFAGCLHIFEHNFFGLPKKDHKGCFIDCIDSSGLVFQTDNFIKSLIQSISEYVYSEGVQEKKLGDVEGSLSQKYNRLFLDAKDTFRKPKYLVPNTIRKKVYDDSIAQNIDSDEWNVFNGLYQLNEAKTSFRLREYDVEEAQKLVLIFRKIRFDYEQSIAQGQFSELVLYNVLMNYFDAAPLIHKMSITTGSQLERNGIDAIHVRNNGNGIEMFLGESKAYDRVQGGFKEAVEESLSDVIVHHQGLISEFDLYSHSAAISEGFESFLTEYLKGKHKDVEVNLVCMVSYGVQQKLTSKNRKGFINETIKMIEEDCKKVDKDVFSKINGGHLERVYFVLFPIREMHELIIKFQKLIGI